MRTNEEIVNAFQAGKQDALADLWRQNERGVQHIADRLAAAGLGEAEDLKQEGFFGLKRAAELWTPEGGASFFSFAVFWIRQAMYSSIRKTGRAVRLPAYLQELLQKYRRFMDGYRKEFGEDPEDARIRAALGIDQKALERLRAAELMGTPASLDGPAGDPEDGLTLADSLASPGDFAEDVCRAVDHEKMARALAIMIGKLSPEKQAALRSRFWEQRPQKSPESQKTVQALHELRHPWNKKKLEAYYFDYLCGEAYKGSLTYFRHTGGSITEALAIRAIERKEKGEKQY